MCATVFRANDGQTQSPSTFIPAYLSEQSQFIEIVRQHMDFLPPKSCNRMVNAIEKPLNVLFGELYPHLLDFENRSYICLTGNLYEELKSQDKIERALRHGVPPEGLQERFPYFTNPMVLCDEQDGAYCGPPPSQRVVNRGQIVFTFEYDPATNQQEFLDHQIRWSIAGTDGKSLLDRLYQRLCRFRDFRQLEVVWSGNKSFHIHCLLDSRHLNRSRFAGEITVPAGSWPEIPDCPMFRAGLMACWAPIEEIVRNTLGIEIDPDTRLKEPERYRRTPWGIRIAVAGNILGFPPGTRVPQIVTYSKGRAYARTGDEWVLDPAKFFLEIRKPRKTSNPATTSNQSVRSLAPATEKSLLAEIAILCERLFGPPANAPFPVSIDRSGDDWLIRFRNNAEDRNPGSVMVGRFHTIMIGSKDADIQARRYEFPVSANQLIDTFLARSTLADELPDRRQTWWERYFRERMDWLQASGISIIPKEELRPVFDRTTAHQTSVIVAGEGVGKTAAIIEMMLETRGRSQDENRTTTLSADEEGAFAVADEHHDDLIRGEASAQPRSATQAAEPKPVPERQSAEVMHQAEDDLTEARLDDFFGVTAASTEPMPQSTGPQAPTHPEETCDLSGFLVVACRSYEQAIKKCTDFNERIAPATGWHGVVLPSFDQVFQEIFPGRRIDREAAAFQGFNTPMEAAHADPDSAQRLNERRYQIQRELGWMIHPSGVGWATDHAWRSSVVIFTVHAVVQNWYRRGGTRYWMHPLFESWAAARAEGDFIEARLIGRQIQNATKLSWVLHDEIGISDLMTKHDKQKVDLVNEFVEGVETSVTPSKGETLPKFEELTLPKKLAEFKKWLRQRVHRSLDTSPPLTFEEMLQIYEIDYSAQDLMVVDPGAEPFGINNTPDSPYLMIKGRAYYAKLRDWWEHVRYKLTVTTTERKILRSLDHIRAKQLQAIEKDPQYGPQLRTWRADTANLGPDDWVPQKPEVPQKFLPIWCVNEYPLTGYLPPDHLRVQIYLDDRARVPRKNDPKRTSVTTIYEEIKAADPNAIVISNCLPDTDAITPAKAKGANDYIGKRIYYVMLHPAQDKYRDLLIENAVFAARNFVQLEFVDEFDQIVGRTLGFRYRPPGSTVNGTIVTGSEAIVITSPKLWKQVAGPLCRYSKYEIMTPRQVKRGGKLP